MQVGSNDTSPHNQLLTIAHMVGKSVLMYDQEPIASGITHIEHKYYFYVACGYRNAELIFLLGSKSIPATKTIAMTVTTKIKTNKQNPISTKTNTFNMQLILPLIFKKSIVTVILNL